MEYILSALVYWNIQDSPERWEKKMEDSSLLILSYLPSPLASVPLSMSGLCCLQLHLSHSSSSPRVHLLTEQFPDFSDHSNAFLLRLFIVLQIGSTHLRSLFYLPFHVAISSLVFSSDSNSHLGIASRLECLEAPQTSSKWKSWYLK